LINVTLPEKYGRFNIDNYSEIKNNLKGVYFFFNNKDELVYVGKTENVKNRVRHHWFGITNTKHYFDEFNYVDVYEVDCAIERDLYETYFINKEDAAYNLSKKFRNTSDGKPKNPNSKRKRIDFVLGEDDMSSLSLFNSLDDLENEIRMYEAVISYSSLSPSWKRKLSKLCNLFLELSDNPYGVFAISQSELSSKLGLKKSDTVASWLKLLDDEFAMLDIIPTVRRSTMTQDVNLIVIKPIRLVSREVS